MKKSVRMIILGLLIVGAAAAALLIAELRLRWSDPNAGFQVGNELGWLRRSRSDLAKVFTVDPDFGFRPILGNDLYNEFGTLKNSYSIDRAPGVTRLLFIGDSVTSRGRIIDALKELYGEEAYEYWNAGVESFNTAQEARYCRTYNLRIKPDHVILTFVYNDFGTTPIAFFNQDNELVVYALNRPSEHVNSWLFRHLYLYRYLLGRIMAARPDPAEDTRAMGVREVRKSLKELRDILLRKGIDFTVLIMPKLKLPEKWRDYERDQQETIIRTLEELGIRYFDLYDPAMKAMKAGTPAGESPRDHWHPGPEIARELAGSLFRDGLLKSN